MEPEGSLKREKAERKPRDVQLRERIDATLRVTDVDFLGVQDDLREPGVETMLRAIKDLLESRRYSGRMLKQLQRNRCKQLVATYKERFKETPESTVELGPQRRKIRADEKQAKKEKRREPKPESKSGTSASNEGEHKTANAPERAHSVATVHDAGPGPAVEPEKKGEAVFQRENWPNLHRRIATYLQTFPVGKGTFFLWLTSGEILLLEGPVENDCRKYLHALGERPYSFRFDRESPKKWKEGSSRSDTKQQPAAIPHFKALFKQAGNPKCEFKK